MQIKNAVCYSLSLDSEDVLAHLRLIGPFQQVGINIINGIVNGQPVCEDAVKGDIIVIQRDFPRKFDDYQNIVKIAKRNGKPIVFDLDDLLFFLPENHPARQSQYYAPSFLPMFEALKDADLITVSTKKLKDILDNYHNNVTVLPNYFDDTLWKFRIPTPKKSKNDVLTIGYMGGNTHEADLQYIVPVLVEITQHYRDKVHLHFWGAEPPEEIRSINQATWTTQYYPSYKGFAEFFQNQSADIFIAPLLDNIFNRCKSSIKFFDYSALGVPGVFSRLEPYTEIVEQGENGLLAESPDDWLKSIVKLIENHELRFQLATMAQTTVRKKWLLSQNAFRWQEAFHDISQTPLNKRQENEINIIQSISTQLLQTFTWEQQHIQALNVQLYERDQEVQALGRQLHEIKISRAWQLVTFLRRIRVFLTRLIVRHANSNKNT